MGNPRPAFAATAALLFVLCLSHDLQGLGAQDPRIVGGRPARPDEFPFQVSVSWALGEEHFCGGSLITERHVLTASHCVILDAGFPLDPDVMVVIAGRTKLDDTENRIVRNVTRITSHPAYVIETKQNDVAVLELAEPFPLSKHIATIPLVEKHVRPQTKCTVTGFGALYHGGPVSNDLMAVVVPVQSKLRCKILFFQRVDIYEGMMCAGYYNGKRDACGGDSGGPFICNGELGGVVSAGLNCAIWYNPGIYSDVNYFRSWIEDQLYITAPNLSTPSTQRRHPLFAH